MKKGIIATSILSILISQNSIAEYMIKIPLEPQSVNFTDAEVTGSINLNPATINRGETSSIVWDYTYADSITIEDVGTFNYKNGSTPVNPLASRSYNVEIVNGTQKKNEVLNLTVIQPNQNISFNANPTRIGIGQSTTLDWNVSNSYGVNISGIGNNVGLVGNYTISPTTSTSYTLTATGYEGVDDATETVNVEVVPNAIINSFSVDKAKVTTGGSVLFSWNVLNAESLALNPFGPLVQKVSGNQSIPFNTAGSFVYALEATSLSGEKAIESKTINVFDPATITSFKVNGQETVDVSPNTDLNFAWTTTSAPNLKLNGTVVNGTSQVLTANNQIGTTTYTLEAINGANESVSDSVIVNVVGDAVINTFTGPASVFANSPFNLNWTATGASKYTLKSNNNTSGIPITEENLNTLLTKTVTPTAAGNYTYTLSAYNTANSIVTRDLPVNVESDPVFTNFTVNGQTSISVSPNTSLNFLGEGFSTGSTLQGRDNSNTVDQGLPSNASSSAGTTVYYAAAKKSLNSITRYSPIRSVSVTVVNAPTIGTITNPTIVFEDAAFTASWSGTNVVNYKIRSNNASSGIAITDVDLGTAVSRAITPTAAGSYTYTITATNAAGVTATKTFTVSVEANPTFTGFTVNGGTSINVSPSATLTFAGTGFSAGATLQGRDSTNASNLVLPSTASTTAGTTTYYAAATKTLNSVTRYSAVRSVSVVTVAAPTIGTITAPTTVFANAAFTASWSGTNVTSYKIRSNNAASGIAITDVALGTAVSRAITPTAAGSYIYTITATNAAGVTATKTFTVSVEANPTFSSFTVNGGTSINVYPTNTITFASGGFSAGSIFQTRNSGNTGDATLPTTAPTNFGTYTYYGAAKKTLNGVTRYSGLRSVIVNVIENWIAIAPIYGTWTNSGTPTNCTAWTPDASTVTSGQSFTQTRNCSQVQTRTVQKREQEQYTKAIRNVGSATTESQTISVPQSQSATGTKSTYEINAGTGATCRDTIYANMLFKFTIISYNYVEVYRQMAPGCLIPGQTSFVGNDGKTYLIGTFYSGLGWSGWSVMRK